MYMNYIFDFQVETQVIWLTHFSAWILKRQFEEYCENKKVNHTNKQNKLTFEWDLFRENDKTPDRRNEWRPWRYFYRTDHAL